MDQIWIRFGIQAAHLDDQVDNGDVGGGHAEGDAVELALELGQHQGNSLGSSGGGGDDVQGRSAGSPEVTVRGVQQPLHEDKFQKGPVRLASRQRNSICMKHSH